MFMIFHIVTSVISEWKDDKLRKSWKVLTHRLLFCGDINLVCLSCNGYIICLTRQYDMCNLLDICNYFLLMY